MTDVIDAGCGVGLDGAMRYLENQMIRWINQHCSTTNEWMIKEVSNLRRDYITLRKRENEYIKEISTLRRDFLTLQRREAVNNGLVRKIDEILSKDSEISKLKRKVNNLEHALQHINKEEK